MTTNLKSGLSAYRDRIDSRLAVLVPQALPGQSELDAAIAESILAPGKRLRPLMAALTAEDLGGDVETAIDAGCAVEMVHAASLVLDDLPCMDNAAMRRGRPAIHMTFGEDVAVLSSIAVLAGAFQLLATIPGLAARERSEAIAILTRAVGTAGLVGGQFEDLRGGRATRALSEIATTNGLKTGSLFSAAVEIGAVVAGANGRVRALLRDFAADLGHAFQLLDDLLDGTSSAVLIGKDVGKDQGKSTIVSLIGRPSVMHRIERHLADAHQRLSEVFGPTNRMHMLLDLIFDKALAGSLEPLGVAAAERRDPGAGAR
ncbi:polyprenyl synthetase family protein [Aurantimonas sp. VKM B-3413]|uniref:polyprenyl synthetase family protein n=1 Tax=Aurantimonas sp. VKM B-3413 TaxID=2779401 RepID=UPI001E4337FB|nr:polyprenyl synthetase family protein [Aurantimonas sp. VKM B-3413]MCB8838734.1 polyprenyl synthetase family protein [Aurantimonas sp. VKM B-3413]